MTLYATSDGEKLAQPLIPPSNERYMFDLRGHEGIKQRKNKETAQEED